MYFGGLQIVFQWIFVIGRRRVLSQNGPLILCIHWMVRSISSPRKSKLPCLISIIMLYNRKEEMLFMIFLCVELSEYHTTHGIRYWFLDSSWSEKHGFLNFMDCISEQQSNTITPKYLEWQWQDFDWYLPSDYLLTICRCKKNRSHNFVPDKQHIQNQATGALCSSCSILSSHD